MDGLTILLILLLLLLLFGIYNRTGEHSKLLNALYDKIKQLNNKVTELTKKINELNQELPEKEVLLKDTEKILPVEKPEIKTMPPPASVDKIPELVKSFNSPAPKKEYPPYKIPDIIKTAGDKLKKDTDIEKFIGENLANKIGIAVLVLGIAFFVKYAIDKNWINETARVAIGLFCGAILIGLAHRFRNSYRSFSSVLVGGGLTVFYFSIAFAFHQYHLISQTTAFILMIIISSFAVLLSLYYDRQELAILATFGGFITPFLVSTGQENYIALFTYLCILNTGLIFLSWFKKWPSINIISLFFTTIIFGGWLVKHLFIQETKLFPHNNALLFATLFYLLFVVMNIINTIRLKNKFNSFDFIILLSINFLFYTAALSLLGYRDDENSKGMFTLLLGLFNLLLAFGFYRKKSVDRDFVFLLMGLAITFISLTAPVHFKGNHIVLYWAAESVLLFSLYLRTRIRLLKIASLILTAAMLVSLLIAWMPLYIYNDSSMPVILNKGFVTTLVASITLFILHRFIKRERTDEELKNAFSPTSSNLMLIAAISTLYVAGLLEIYYQFSSRFTLPSLHVIYLQTYTFIFITLLLSFFKRNSSFPLMKLLFTAFCLFVYLSNISIAYRISFAFLTQDTNGIFFVIHPMGSLLLLWLLYSLVRFICKKENKNWINYQPAIMWITIAGILVILCVEIYTCIMWVSSRNNWLWWENLYYKAGLSIIWSTCSFILMWVGMKYHLRILRIISLTLFTITLLKLFLFDIRNIPPGGKIAAFILLGVLLLVVSFMYQRLKKIIIDNKTTV